MPLPWLTIPVSVLMLLIILAAIVTFAPALMIRKMQRSELRHLCRGKLALTYDDGPGKRFTPKLLDLLARHCARATFYLVGFRIDDASHLVERTLAEGHEIGNHGYWHRNAFRLMPWSCMRDVRDGFTAVRRWNAGHPYYRPPFGRLTIWNWLSAQQHGAPVCWWTCDARDQIGDLSNPRAIVDNVIQSGGAVVLMHSHDSGLDREQYVLDLTERLILAAREHGLTICAMSDVLNGRNVQNGEAAA